MSTTSWAKQSAANRLPPGRPLGAEEDIAIRFKPEFCYTMREFVGVSRDPRPVSSSHCVTPCAYPDQRSEPLPVAEQSSGWPAGLRLRRCALNGAGSGRARYGTGVSFWRKKTSSLARRSWNSHTFAGAPFRPLCGCALNRKNFIAAVTICFVRPPVAWR